MQRLTSHKMLFFICAQAWSILSPNRNPSLMPIRSSSFRSDFLSSAQIKMCLMLESLTFRLDIIGDLVTAGSLSSAALSFRLLMPDHQADILCTFYDQNNRYQFSLFNFISSRFFVKLNKIRERDPIDMP